MKKNKQDMKNFKKKIYIKRNIILDENKKFNLESSNSFVIKKTVIIAMTDI